MNKTAAIEKVLKQHTVQIRVDADKAYFTNIADIHMGLNNRRLFQETIEFLLSIPNMYFGIGGDSTNNSTRVSKGNVIEEELVGSEQVYAIVEDLRPLVAANRLLYIIDGNHGAGRMRDLVYSTPEENIAHLLGRPDLYKREQVIVYFNVRKNCYVHFAQHASGKKREKFAWVNADVVWREHIHEYKAESNVVVEHNKYAKKPIIKEVWEIYSGHWQVLPSYVKMNGYRVVLPGCYIVEMSGVAGDWRITPWRDDHLFHAIANGYKVA